MPRNNRGVSTPRVISTPQGGRGARGGGRPRGRGGRLSSFVPEGSYSQSQSPASFSLADEARQTSKHSSSFWDKNSSLRFKPVQFVSAGTIEPLKELDDHFLKAGLGEKTHLSEIELAEPQLVVREWLAQTPLDDDEDVAPNELADEDAQDSEFQVIGPGELEHEVQVAVAKEKIPSFYFDLKGEPSNSTKSKKPVRLPERPDIEQSSSGEEVILFKGRDASLRTKAPSSIAISQKHTISQISNPKNTITMSQMHTEIRAVKEQIRISSPVDTPSSVDQKTPKDQIGSRGNNKKRPQQREADDDAALIADYIENMRESGDMMDFLGLDSRNRRDLGGPLSQCPSTSSEDDSAMPGTQTRRILEEVLDMGDEGNLVESEVDDETLARLLAGHDLGVDPAAGLPGILSDSESSDEEELIKRKIATFDEEFDVMDWERPSLQRKRKGKRARAQLNVQVSDSETEQILQAAWKNDRMKKSERKKEREQLRALGQLGKHDPEDLRIKYPTGMTMQQISDELRIFIQGSEASLTLTPMDAHARKIIHEVANKLNIKSKSTGKADSRRPTLYRTGRTVSYTESKFNQVFNQVNRRYFPRLDGKGKRSQRPPPIRSGGGSGNAAASYQEGEIVGAAAPELGSGNRGRAMLEKMGWSSGTALGTDDNKGILQPVAQTMKKSKAGLG